MRSGVLDKPLTRQKAKLGKFWGVVGWKSGILDGQNRQSPIASDFGSRTQIAALFAILLYPNV